MNGNASSHEYGLPKQKLFFKLSEISEMGFMSVVKAKKMLYDGEMCGVKNGRNWRIPRDELLRVIRAGEVRP